MTDEQVKVSKGKERCVGEERMLVRRGTQGRVTVLCFGAFLSHVQNNRNPIFLFIGYIYFTLCAIDLNTHFFFHLTAVLPLTERTVLS